MFFHDISLVDILVSGGNSFTSNIENDLFLNNLIYNFF
jgi:hypothetical protein